MTMAMSVIHRATGVALYFGSLLLAWWLIAAASGPAAYAYVQAFMGSWFGLLVMFGFTWSLMHHLFSGIRYLVWDLGYGFDPAAREWLTWAAAIAGIVATILLWVAVFAFGGGR